MKGEKRDRQTAKQSRQPLGKLKIRKGEEEKKGGGGLKFIIVRWNKINDRMNEIKYNEWIISRDSRVNKGKKQSKELLQ